MWILIYYPYYSHNLPTIECSGTWWIADRGEKRVQLGKVERGTPHDSTNPPS